MAKDKSAGGPVVGGEPALVSAGPGSELFLPSEGAVLIPALPFAAFRGGADERGQPLAFIPGVPARDLTRAEWDALPDEQRRLCLTTKLYDVAGEIPAEG